MSGLLTLGTPHEQRRMHPPSGQLRARKPPRQVLPSRTGTTVDGSVARLSRPPPTQATDDRLATQALVSHRPASDERKATPWPPRSRPAWTLAGSFSRLSRVGLLDPVTAWGEAALGGRGPGTPAGPRSGIAAHVSLNTILGVPLSVAPGCDVRICCAWPIPLRLARVG